MHTYITSYQILWPCVCPGRLLRLTCGLHDALQDDDDLELLVHQGALGQIKEGALGIDLVADGERRDQEELVGACAEAHIQLTLIQR